jgi:hypothetical protein
MIKKDSLYHSPYSKIKYIEVKTYYVLCTMSEYDDAIGESYIFHIHGEEYTYARDKLPNFIKHKLVMINSIDNSEWNLWEDSREISAIDCFIIQHFTKKNPEFINIGYKVKNEVYVFTLSEEEINIIENKSSKT